jgi:hypothetical protein
MSSSANYEGLVERLFTSFGDLEKAIAGAREALLKSGSTHKSVFERLESYSGILTNQRRLTNELAEHLKKSDQLQVSRTVAIINGLSAMIIEDARDILAGISGEPEIPVALDELKIC